MRLTTVTAIVGIPILLTLLVFWAIGPDNAVRGNHNLGAAYEASTRAVARSAQQQAGDVVEASGQFLMSDRIGIARLHVPAGDESTRVRNFSASRLRLHEPEGGWPEIHFQQADGTVTQYPNVPQTYDYVWFRSNRPTDVYVVIERHR